MHPMRTKRRKVWGDWATSSLPRRERPLLGGGALCWRFGAALKVLIVTALTITKYLNQWFSATGGVRGRLRPAGNIFAYHSLRKWVRDFNVLVNILQAHDSHPQQS